MKKREIRNKMILMRRNQSLVEKQNRDQSILTQIRNHPHFINAKTVSIFHPISDEIDLTELLEIDKTFLFPRVHQSNMEFYVYHKNMKWIKSSFGISEPSTEETLYQDTIDLMIVPALAISKNNSRVGYGKGYYDRYIKDHKIKYKLGVIYDFQEVDEIETTPLDQKLDEYIKGSL